MDAVLQTSDFPCMLRSLPNSAVIAPPVFGYNSHPTYADIPFPDYSYWGHEYSRLLGASCACFACASACGTVADASLWDPARLLAHSPPGFSNPHD